MRRIPHALTAALLGALALAAPAVARTVEVPLDRSGSTPGTIRLAVEQVRAARSTRPPVIALSGGPGQSALGWLDSYRADLGAKILRARDLVAFDARGTGRSGLLRCPELQRTPVPRDTAAAEACARELGENRRFYTTIDQAEDIEAVRVAIKAPKVALYGVSYGTKVALTYAQLHPDRVDRLILDSVVPSDGSSALSQETLGAMPRVLGGALEADLAKLIAGLRSQPLTGTAFDASGRARSTTADPAAMFDVLLAGDFNPILRQALPAAVAAAAQGDTAPLLRLVEDAHASDRTPLNPADLSAGLYAATSCEELAFPWAPTAPAEERLQKAREALANGAVLGPFGAEDVLTLDWIPLCLRWPVTPGPRPLPNRLPDVPALLLSGDRDLRTPLESAQAVKAMLPRGRLLVVPGAGHAVIGSDFTGCARRALRRFMAGTGTPASCRALRTGFEKWFSVPPRDAATLRPVRGVPGRPGRTLRALLHTLDDADGALGLSASGRAAGGLHGGRVRARGSGLELRRFQYIPGVVVDATPRTGGGLAIRISGPAASAGRLTLERGGRLHGRLGGRSVAVKLY
jgi:pimeloyl-ACP methyl ester carboxylesterase